MVLKLCVACNHKVPGAKKICVCGHVFKQIRMIGGKRYSGYRAMCSRDNSRKCESRKGPGRRLMIQDGTRANKRLGGSPKQRGRLSKEMSTSEVLGNKPPVNKQAQKSTQTRQDMDQKSPELLEKLSEALNDINKRIARQSLLWIILKSARC